MNQARVAFLVMIFVFCLFSLAPAEEEGATFFDSTLEFDSPEALAPDTEYQFDISVYNAGVYQQEVRGEWIYAIDLTMPSANYVVDEESISNPDPLHPCEKGVDCVTAWESAFDPASMTISWQTVAPMSGWAPVGDIREEEMLAFSFVATTDADATDKFPWVLHGDLGNDVEGAWYFDGDDDDTEQPDDDTPLQDDDDDEERVDDEDDGGGCGC